MRASILLLALAMVGMLVGAWLAGGRVGVGLALVADSLALAAIAVLRDDGRPAPAKPTPSVVTALEKFRQAN